MNNKKVLSYVYDLASILLTAVLVVSIIFTFVFKVSTVSGESMENTLSNGDSLIITAVTGEIKYGDVVVISQPNGYDKVLIKRVIATGGQTVSFNRFDNSVLVDGKKLDEPYIKEPMRFLYSMNETYEVPEGMLFVMGDNRNESADSRDREIGLIDERYVVGKVIYRLGDTHIFNSDFTSSQE